MKQISQVTLVCTPSDYYLDQLRNCYLRVLKSQTTTNPNHQQLVIIYLYMYIGTTAHPVTVTSEGL